MLSPQHEWWMYVFVVVSTLIAFLYYRIKKSFRYFKDRNIPYVKARYFLGSDPQGVLFRLHIGYSWDRIYKQLESHKLGGFFQMTMPFLMVRDPYYVQQILISSFDHFMDRPFLVDEKTNPLDAHLFFLGGNKWRLLRNKLSPIFSVGKLRWMFQEMDKCGDVFIECVDKLADGEDRDLQDELANYATDVIGSCAFGIEIDSLKNPNSKFRQIGREFFDTTKLNLAQIFFLVRLSMPRIVNWLKLRSIPRNIEEYFISTTKNIIENRIKTGIQRKDFVQLLLQLKEKGTVEVDPNEEEEENEKSNQTGTEKFEITDHLLAAQSFVFYLAGFETTAKSLYFILFMFSLKQNIQERARKEVQRVKAKHGQFTYDALKEMSYVDMCISETLRIYPPVTMLVRECVKDFTFSDGTFIERGTNVVLPIFSIQRDPKYFPDPMKFEPDRFEIAPARGTYAPFGDGPRICIGKRFALIEIKIVLARLLERYRFGPSPLNKDRENINFNPTSTLLTPENGFYMKISKL